ncbi:MAG: phage head-tail connector protein [Cetobacterium sp.]
MAYARIEDLSARLGVGDTAEDGRLATLLDLASAEVDDYCGRSFAVPSAASDRLFVACHPTVLEFGPRNEVGDTTGLVVAEDRDGDGVFETTIASTAYQLEPLTQPVTGWPWTRIRLVDGSTWQTSSYGRPTVRVTARWGWAAVPQQVTEATLLIGAELWKAKDAPLGVVGFAEFGAIRIRNNPLAARLLERFRHVDSFLGVA